MHSAYFRGLIIDTKELPETAQAPYEQTMTYFVECDYGLAGLKQKAKLGDITIYGLEGKGSAARLLGVSVELPVLGSEVTEHYWLDVDALPNHEYKQSVLGNWQRYLAMRERITWIQETLAIQDGCLVDKKTKEKIDRYKLRPNIEPAVEQTIVKKPVYDIPHQRTSYFAGKWVEQTEQQSQISTDEIYPKLIKGGPGVGKSLVGYDLFISALVRLLSNPPKAGDGINHDVYLIAPPQLIDKYREMFLNHCTMMQLAAEGQEIANRYMKIMTFGDFLEEECGFAGKKAVGEKEFNTWMATQIKGDKEIQKAKQRGSMPSASPKKGKNNSTAQQGQIDKAFIAERRDDLYKEWRAACGLSENEYVERKRKYTLFETREQRKCLYQIFQSYKKELEKNNQFDEASATPSVVPYKGEIIVDEGHNLTEVNFRLLVASSTPDDKSPPRSIIIYDENQSLTDFGSKLDYLENLPLCAIYTLEDNFRCDPVIAKAAKEIIRIKQEYGLIGRKQDRLCVADHHMDNREDNIERYCLVRDDSKDSRKLLTELLSSPRCVAIAPAKLVDKIKKLYGTDNVKTPIEAQGLEWDVVIEFGLFDTDIAEELNQLEKKGDKSPKARLMEHFNGGYTSMQRAIDTLIIVTTHHQEDVLLQRLSTVPHVETIPPRLKIKFGLEKLSLKEKAALFEDYVIQLIKDRKQANREHAERIWIETLCRPAEEFGAFAERYTSKTTMVAIAPLPVASQSSSSKDDERNGKQQANQPMKQQAKKPAVLPGSKSLSPSFAPKSTFFTPTSKNQNRGKQSALTDHSYEMQFMQAMARNDLGAIGGLLNQTPAELYRELLQNPAIKIEGLTKETVIVLLNRGIVLKDIWAVERLLKHPEILSILMNKDGKVLFDAAERCGDVDIIERMKTLTSLIKKYTDIWEAIINNDFNSVVLLLKDIDISDQIFSAIDGEGNTLLKIAAMVEVEGEDEGAHKIVKLLSHYMHKEVNAANNVGMTALHSAMKRRHLYAVHHLLKYSNIDVSIQTKNEHPVTVLDTAVCCYKKNKIDDKNKNKAMMLMKTMRLLLEHPSLKIELLIEETVIFLLRINISLNDTKAIEILLKHPKISSILMSEEGKALFIYAEERVGVHVIERMKMAIKPGATPQSCAATQDNLAPAPSLSFKR